MKITRKLAEKCQALAKHFPVITVTGPRQSGKTTMLRDVFPAHSYILLEETHQQEFANTDPIGFLDQFGSDANLFIDEAQLVPKLFSYIQGRVDKNNRAGQYILSGSQHFLLNEAVSQSLAGRAAVLQLLPFSLSEVCSRSGLSVDAIGHSKPPIEILDAPGHLLESMFTGFYPRPIAQAIPISDWMPSYYRTYLERDVRTLANIGDLDSFSRFVRLLAGRCGQLLDLTSLGNDAGVSHTTVGRWISILEASFLVFRLRPYFRNFSKRLIKSPKIYFVDTGLLCYLLGIRSSEELSLHPLRGQIFESFIIGLLYKDRLNNGLDPDFYFWRDSHGLEIDVVWENGAGVNGLELKSAATFSPAFVQGLQKWSSLVEGMKTTVSVVYGGDQSINYKEIPVYSWRCF
jgi:predicted AAA+ superfamily ATPase